MCVCVGEGGKMSQVGQNESGGAKQVIEHFLCSHGNDIVPSQSVPKSGTERGCVHTGTGKNQAEHSKAGSEIGGGGGGGGYGKVNQN